MNRIIAPGQPGDQQGQPPPTARPAMRTGTGIFLITVGAILLFALKSGSPHWLNLQIVGVILILAGVLGLTLPRLARARRRGRLAATLGPPWPARRPRRPVHHRGPGRRRPAGAGYRRQRPDASRRPPHLRAAPLSRAPSGDCRPHLHNAAALTGATPDRGRFGAVLPSLSSSHLAGPWVGSARERTGRRRSGHSRCVT